MSRTEAYNKIFAIVYDKKPLEKMNRSEAISMIISQWESADEYQGNENDESRIEMIEALTALGVTESEIKRYL